MITEAQFILDEDGLPAIQFRLDGRLVRVLSLKKTFLDAGLVIVHAWDDGPPLTTRATLPADPRDGRPEPMEFESATSDPQVVALARKFWDANRQEPFPVGPVQP